MDSRFLALSPLRWITRVSACDIVYCVFLGAREGTFRDWGKRSSGQTGDGRRSAAPELGPLPRSARDFMRVLLTVETFAVCSSTTSAVNHDAVICHADDFRPDWCIESVDNRMGRQVETSVEMKKLNCAPVGAGLPKSVSWVKRIQQWINYCPTMYIFRD